MNIFNGIGRIVADPGISVSQSGKKIGRYSLAISSRSKEADGSYHTNFIPCVCFDKQAEFAEKFLNKGKMIGITGELNQTRYKDKDGNTRTIYQVYVREHSFAEGSSQSQPQAHIPVPTPEPKAEPTPAQNYGFMDLPSDIDDTGLPFN